MQCMFKRVKSVSYCGFLVLECFKEIQLWLRPWVFHLPWSVLLHMQSRLTRCYNLKVLLFNKEVRRRNSLINQSIGE